MIKRQAILQVFVSVALLVACSSQAKTKPSIADIQTAIAQTQSVPTTPAKVYDVRIILGASVPRPDLDGHFKYECFRDKTKCDSGTFQMVWSVGGNTSSCSGSGCDFTNGFLEKIYIAKDGDVVRVQIDSSKTVNFSVGCKIYVGKIMVSRGDVEGIGSAICEVTVGPDLQPVK